jgi:hypothetical protein
MSVYLESGAVRMVYAPSVCIKNAPRSRDIVMYIISASSSKYIHTAFLRT